MDDIAQEQRKFAVRQIALKSFAKQILQSRRKISPQSHRTKTQPCSIDRQIIGIIKHSTQQNMNRLSTLLKSKGFAAASPTALSPIKTRFFSQEYCRQQLKFIKSTQKQHSQREKLKCKLKIRQVKAKPFHDLDRGSLSYFESSERSEGKETRDRGRYRQVLHPLCGLYQKQADRTFRARLKLSDPFSDLNLGNQP